jgi:hypothetical protein
MNRAADRRQLDDGKREGHRRFLSNDDLDLLRLAKVHGPRIKRRRRPCCDWRLRSRRRGALKHLPRRQTMRLARSSVATLALFEPDSRAAGHQRACKGVDANAGERLAERIGNGGDDDATARQREASLT